MWLTFGHLSCLQDGSAEVNFIMGFHLSRMLKPLADIVQS